MTRFRTLAWLINFVALLSAAGLPARADVPPPEGWSQQVSRDGILMGSPPTRQGDQVTYVIFPLAPLAERASPWAFFDQRTADAAGLFGRMDAFKVMSRNSALAENSFTASATDGSIVHGLLLGYRVDQGFQTMMFAWPSTSGPSTVGNLAVNDARNHVKRLRMRGYNFVPRPVADVEPPATPAPVANGGEQNVEAVVIGSAVIGSSTAIVPYLLLKDGRAFLQVAESPRDFNPASRAPGSYGTGRWRKTADGYDISYPNASPDQLYDSGRFLPARPGFRLVGTYRAIGANAGTSWGEQFVFYADSTVDFAQGSSTSSPGANSVGRGSTRGRYVIEGWTITITDGNGRTERRLFASHPADPPVSVVIGEANYRRQ